MSDKERLGAIKEARKRILDEKSFQKKCIFLNSFEELGYLDWLIEQAEKAERYEKALREIANEQEVGEGDFNADDVANNLIATAKEALEGTE